MPGTSERLPSSIYSFGGGRLSAPERGFAMFLRFVTANVIRSLRVEAGVFTVAYDVARESLVPDYERSRMEELLFWFDRNLRVPERLSRSTRSCDYRAICWFKPSAHEHLRQMWELTWILENNFVFIRTIRTRHPGYIVYEDEAQVAAEPFRDLRLKRC